MKLGFSQQEIIGTAKSLGLPTDGFIQRRIARAYDLVESNKVSKIDDGIFRVRSQYEPDKSYIVNLNHGEPSCDCPDGTRTIFCKHRIASMIVAQKAKSLIVKETTDDVPSEYLRRSWFIKQSNRCITVVEELNRLVWCNCGAHYDNDCIHKQAVIKAVMNELKQAKVKYENGSKEAAEIETKLNGQLTKSENSGNGDAKSPSQLDLSDPFQESESLDIDQIEGRRNGELAWKLGSGEYVISYLGIMTLAEKHGIEFDEVSVNDNTVIAKAKNGNERISGKPIYDNANTAIELAKRNAARQLLPLPEILALQKKAQLEAEFDWQVAYQKCCEIAGGKAQCDIIINDLVKAGKLRQAASFEYNRTEWLMIHAACKQDANDGGDNTPSSPDENWREWYQKCVKVSSIVETDTAIDKVLDWRAKYRKDLISDSDWQKVFETAKELRDDYNRVQAAKSERAFLIKQNEYDYIQAKTGFNVRRKQIEKIFGRKSSSNNGTRKLTKLYDEKPIEFEVDTAKPNLVKLIYSNGKVAQVYDQVIYESVLRA